MASLPRSRGHAPARARLREPVYVPVSPAQQIAQLICQTFADPSRSVRLSLLDVTPDHITLSVITQPEPDGDWQRPDS